MVAFEGGVGVSSPRNPLGLASLKIRYVDSSDFDSNLMPLNRDLVSVDGVFTNESVCSVRQALVSELVLTVKNNSGGILLHRNVVLQKSMDISPHQLVEVLNEKVIVGDLISSTASFSEAMFTQYLRTNVLNMSVLRSLNGGNKVNYVTVQDWEMSFRSDQLSTVEQVHYKIPLVSVDGVVTEIPVFHAVDPSHELYGDAFTTVDPRTKFPNMLDSEWQSWRLMVWKSDTSVEKLAIRFENVPDGRGGFVESPVLTLGEGFNPSNPSDIRGKMQIYVDHLGGHLKFTNSRGKASSIRVNEDGMRGFNFHTGLVKMEQYTNGCRLFFLDDPDPTKVIFNQSVDGLLTSVVINDVVVPITRFNTTLV